MLYHFFLIKFKLFFGMNYSKSFWLKITSNFLQGAFCEQRTSALLRAKQTLDYQNYSNECNQSIYLSSSKTTKICHWKPGIRVDAVYPCRCHLYNALIYIHLIFYISFFIYDLRAGSLGVSHILIPYFSVDVIFIVLCRYSSIYNLSADIVADSKNWNWAREK